MDWLEQNLDAYRIIAEILDDLRDTLRTRLDAVHGREWYKVGLPPGILERLVERKEQEKAIDWYESEYQQIMSYALFPDLLEILEHNAEAFPQIVGLAPTSALLNARFLELEVMRAKLGRARPISETELSFLGTFHLRFRKAIENHRAHQDPAPPSEPAAQEPEPAAAAAAEERPMPPPVQPVQPPDPQPEAAAAPPTPSVQEPPPPDQPAEASAEPPAEGTPVAEPEPPSATEPSAELENLAASVQEAPPTPPAGDPPANASEPSPEPEPARPANLEDAVEAGDDQAILRELYREVTAIAEGIWTKDIPPPARVWAKISVSDWYERQFSDLGLRPLSDFYDIISKVDQQMRNGASKEQLQEFLKESNFAQTLLALRDMFQKNQI